MNVYLNDRVLITKKMVDWLEANQMTPIHVVTTYGMNLVKRVEHLLIHDGHMSNENGDIMFKFKNEEDAVKFKLVFF